MTESGTRGPWRWITRGKNRWALAGTLVLLGALILGLRVRRGEAVTFLTAKVQQGEIRDAVDATGTVNAVITVQVGSQVSGTIAKLAADFNSHVRRGEIIALIEPSLLEGALLQATADLETAQASVGVAEADLAKANATLAQAKADYDRAVAMAKDGIVTQQELDSATGTYESAKASRDGAAASVVQANAQVRQKAAAVAVARTNLDHTVIRSPIDGIVVARNVDVGQTVAASLQAPTIFTIAQDLTKMQVYTNVDESDVGRIKVGQLTTFKVDAFPTDTFRGVVSQIRMNPTTIQNVVTYDAIIDFANPELKLFPGMTAYVTIPVATVEHVVKLPNAALRFKPPLSADAIRALYARYGLEDGGSARSDSSVSGRVATSFGQGTPAGSEDSGRRDPGAAPVVVWKLSASHTPVPVRITLGITDHAYTEVTSVTAGNLTAGDDVITTAVSATSGGSGARPLRP